MKKLIMILSIIALLLLAIPVSAIINVDATTVTSTSILWTWPAGTDVTNISIDGVYVCGFNPTGTNFVLSGLGPSETHTITVLRVGDSGSNITQTLADANTAQSTDLMSFLNSWGYLILIIICCVVGMMRKLGIFLIVASIVSLYALVSFITTNTIGDSSVFVQLPFLIYVVFFIFPLFLCLVVKGGVTK